MHVLDHGSGFVNAVAFFVHDTGIYALTAGQDALIYAYHIDTDGPVSVSGSPTLSLVGHASNVCSLRTHSAYIVSGSWDSTVRVWKNWECVATLAGHSHSVWSVLPIDEDRILSASADKTVCLWSISSPKEPLYVFEGATQAVRDIARVSDTAFVSAGNDGQLRLYPIHGGAPYKTFASLPAFVYALAPLADGFVSSGEDRCVRVWAHDALTQLVPVPALSVWCVCTLSNGDMACGASDGTVTIFTRDAARAALLPEQEAFAADIATQSLSAPEVQGVRVCEEHDTTPGASEGDVRVVRQGSTSTRYHWSTHTQQWIPTGIVTEGASSSQKTLFEGKAYDYVFDVDIADGVPPLKLPYNVTDNAYVAAVSSWSVINCRPRSSIRSSASSRKTRAWWTYRPQRLWIRTQVRLGMCRLSLRLSPPCRRRGSSRLRTSSWRRRTRRCSNSVRACRVPHSLTTTRRRWPPS